MDAIMAEKSYSPAIKQDDADSAEVTIWFGDERVASVLLGDSGLASIVTPSILMMEVQEVLRQT